MASENVVNVTSANFDSEVVGSAIPVVVDFWATWCAPCRMIAPVLDEIAEENKGRFKVAKVDVDAEAALAARFSIRSIPTLIFFKGGEVRGQISGAVPKGEILSKLQELV